MVPGDGVKGPFLIPGDGVMGPFLIPRDGDRGPFCKSTHRLNRLSCSYLSGNSFMYAKQSSGLYMMPFALQIL